MLKEIIVELDKAAKAFDLSDIDTAALCCRKAVEGHIKMKPPEASPNPSATDTESEFLKAVIALETKDFSLAALCLRKATAGLSQEYPAQVSANLELVAENLHQQNFGSVANALRDGIKGVIGNEPVRPIDIQATPD